MPDPHSRDDTRLAHVARDRLTVIVGRAQLLLRHARGSRDLDPGRLEAGLTEIEAAARDLMPAVERLEERRRPSRDGSPHD